MLPPPPSSSPQRPVLINLTNDERETPTNSLLIPPPDRKRAPTTDPWALPSSKRVKLEEEVRADSGGETDSDEEEEDVTVPVRRAHRATTAYGMWSAMVAGPSLFARIPQREHAVDFTTPLLIQTPSTYPVHTTIIRVF